MMWLLDSLQILVNLRANHFITFAMRPTPSRVPNQDQVRDRDVINGEFQPRGPGMRKAKKPVEDINSVRELFAGFFSTMMALAPSRQSQKKRE